MANETVRVSADITLPAKAALKGKADRLGMKFSVWLKRQLERLAREKTA